MTDIVFIRLAGYLVAQVYSLLCLVVLHAAGWVVSRCSRERS